MAELADTVVDLSANAAAVSKTYEVVESFVRESRYTLTKENDLNELTGAGVYTFEADSVPANAPYYCGGIVVTSGGSDDEERTQSFSSDRGGKSASRTFRNGKWSKWQYDGVKSGAFQGKTVSILGDSISSYRGYVPTGVGYKWYYDGKKSGVSTVSETWWKRLIDQTGMTLCVNNSISSSCVSSSVDNGTIPATSDERIKGLAKKDGTSPDVILIFMGTNDYGRAIPRGNWNCDAIPAVEDDSNFSNAYAIMLEKITGMYPDAKVYCCTLPYTGRFSLDRRGTDRNRFAVTRSEWNDIIRRVASYYDCEIIEFEHCGIDADNLPFYSGDDAVEEDGVSGEGVNGRGLHPNARGHELLYLEALKHFLPEA